MRIYMRASMSHLMHVAWTLWILMITSMTVVLQVKSWTIKEDNLQVMQSSSNVQNPDNIVGHGAQEIGAKLIDLLIAKRNYAPTPTAGP